MILQCLSTAKINGYYKLRNVPPTTSHTFFSISFPVSPAQMSQKARILCDILPPFFLVTFPGIRGPLQPLRSRQQRRDVQMQQKPILFERNIITA